MQKLILYPLIDPTVPFSQLQPKDITFYFHVSNKTGRKESTQLSGGKTCGAACKHCYFQTLPAYEISVQEGIAITNDLRKAGYDVGIVTADSFSNLSLYDIGMAGSAFRYDAIVPQNNGGAWTSGIPLTATDWQARLNDGWKLGYGSITLSLYGTVIPYPISGTPQAKTIRQAIANIQTWNEGNICDGKYSIVTNTMVHRENCSKEQLRKVVLWCLKNKIDVCRFNCFANFLNDPTSSQLEMHAVDIYRFYGVLRELLDEFRDTPLSFAVSEDMSPHGIEQVVDYFPDSWKNYVPGSHYWCRAGYRLFAINKRENEIIVNSCVDNWNGPTAGCIIKNSIGYTINWNTELIEELRSAIIKGKLFGCWGGVGKINSGTDNRGLDVDFSTQQRIFAAGKAARM